MLLRQDIAKSKKVNLKMSFESDVYVQNHTVDCFYTQSLNLKSVDAMVKKVRAQEEAMEAGQKERELLQSRINSLSQDLDKKKREEEKAQKEISEMKREKDKIVTNMQKQEGWWPSGEGGSNLMRWRGSNATLLPYQYVPIFHLRAANIEKLQGIIKMDAQIRKDLDKQVDKFKDDLKKNRFTIHALEKDRDR